VSTPSDGSQTLDFDAVVLGAGPAGEVCAARLAQAGMSIALVERDLVGGECAFFACMPSKALLRPGQVLAEAGRVAGAREAITGPLDVGSVLARRDQIVHGLDDAAQLPRLAKRSITLIRGHGRLAGERTVVVGARLLRAATAVVVATGSVAALPSVPGLAEAHPWTNRRSTTAERVPETLLVLGGGTVGVELASAYASLGASVTLLEAGERLIAAEEPFASELVREGLERDGVRVLLGTIVRRVAARQPGGPARAECADGSIVQADEMLLASGRRPLTDDIGLDSVGVTAGGYIEVGPTMQVPGHEWLYVVGDANGRALLTHVAKQQARIAAAEIAGSPLPSGPDVVPRVIFSEPQVAAVGHTSVTAKGVGREARLVTAEIESVAGASFVGHGAGGRAALLIEGDRLIGATFVGVEVAEWLHAATIAIVGEVPLAQLSYAVPSFPTRSEVWLALLDAAGTG
jgi:pyruvate/2-oxoglutarate dehydrogenase complex dihydrolipoamide dehydrogenase (E3) component